MVSSAFKSGTQKKTIAKKPVFAQIKKFAGALQYHTHIETYIRLKHFKW